MNEYLIIFLALMALGFYRNRKFLIQWSKNWWEQMKIAWNGGKDERKR